LPVLENEIVIGIISISDVVKAIIECKRYDPTLKLLYYTIGIRLK
jgi:CBS domain-containing protein